MFLVFKTQVEGKADGSSSSEDPQKSLISKEPQKVKEEDVIKRDLKGLEALPNELFHEIASHLEDRFDVCRMRLISKQIAHGVLAAFERVLVKNRTIYPRYDSLAHFAFLLRAFKSLDSHVRSVCLVAEGLKVHEYGSVWAWEDFLQWEGVECTAKDLDIIDKINADHENELSMTDAFIHRGSYRAMLGQLLSECPNLEVINVRKLKPGEQIPGWAGATKFKELSFYRPDLDTKFIYYGDWQYDTVHYRVTMYKDEFGDDIIEPGAGPQAGFTEDMIAALSSTGRGFEVNFLPA